VFLQNRNTLNFQKGNMQKNYIWNSKAIIKEQQHCKISLASINIETNISLIYFYNSKLLSGNMSNGTGDTKA